MRKIITLSIITVLFIVLSTQAKHLYPEATYQQAWCDKHGGKMEVELPDNARVDCVATIDGIRYAIEFDFSRGAKIYECIGQSLYYALMTGYKAGAVLIVEEPKDNFYLNRFRKVADKYGIRYWVITPNDLP